MSTTTTTISFDAKTYTLTQDAYCDGTNQEILYLAHAVGDDGETYLVTWVVTEAWQAASDRIRAAALADKNADAADEQLLQDESDACIWDSPSAVVVR